MTGAFVLERAGTILGVPSDWPAALQLYVFWLALVIWNRESAGD